MGLFEYLALWAFFSQLVFATSNRCAKELSDARDKCRHIGPNCLISSYNMTALTTQAKAFIKCWNVGLEDNEGNNKFCDCVHGELSIDHGININPEPLPKVLVKGPSGTCSQELRDARDKCRGVGLLCLFDTFEITGDTTEARALAMCWNVGLAYSEENNKYCDCVEEKIDMGEKAKHTPPKSSSGLIESTSKRPASSPSKPTTASLVSSIASNQPTIVSLAIAALKHI